MICFQVQSMSVGRETTNKEMSPAQLSMKRYTKDEKGFFMGVSLPLFSAEKIFFLKKKKFKG